MAQFFFWVSLEVNMMMVLPLLASPSSPTSSEVSLKYFISQSIASVLFLSVWLISCIYFCGMLEVLPIFILFKLGLPPFHTWLVSIILASPYKSLLLIMFIQKYIPLHILSNLNPPFSVLSFMFLISIILCLTSLKNISSVRAMLVISAWGNTAWMALAALSGKLWVAYLSLYGVFLSTTLFIFDRMNLNKLSSLMKGTPLSKIVCSANLLNLAGLPPFSGFLIKLVLLKSFFFTTSLSLIIFLLFLSLCVLFSYLAISYYMVGAALSSSQTILSELTLVPVVLSTLSLVSFPILLMMAT